MYARKGDLLQFIIKATNRTNLIEVPYTYCICPIDIEYQSQTTEIDLRTNKTKTYIERDFHRFNVIKSVDDNLQIVYSDNNNYRDRPKSSLFVFGEEPNED